LQIALQKLKPDSWKSFTFKDEYLAEHPDYANYEPQSHVDWLPEYRSMEQETSEDKGNERSKWKWSEDIEENAEYSNNVQSGKNDCHLHSGLGLSARSVTATKTQGHTYNSQSNANAETMPLPQHRYATQTRQELKRSRSEAELDEISETAAGGIGRQLKKKHVD